MAETRQIGRVEEVDVLAYGRQARLRVEFKTTDGVLRALIAAVTHELLVDYLGVWGEVALQATLKRLCWVVHNDTTIFALAPLMEDEGQTFDLIPASAVQRATMPAEAPQTPATAPEAAAAEKPTPEQAERWKTVKSRANTLKLNIEHCRPTPGLSREDVEALLVVAEALVAGEQAKAQVTA